MKTTPAAMLASEMQLIFSTAAASNRRRYGVDHAEVRNVIENPEEVRHSTDPRDPGTQFEYFLGQLPDGRWLEVTRQVVADRDVFLVHRVIVLLPEDYG
jgi:uncharacterized DUF497 family protein